MQRRLLLMVLVLVVADALTKLAALRFLLLERSVVVTDWCSLSLTLNETGLGSDYRKLFGQGSQLFVAAVYVLMTPVVINIQSRRWRFGVKVLTAFAIYAALLLTARSASAFVSLPTLNPWTANLVARAAAFPLLIAFLTISRSTYFRFLWALALACGIGNALSLLYPPFKIVDFIQVEPATALFGTGIFNLADVYADAAKVLLLVSPLYFGLCSLSRRSLNRLAWMRPKANRPHTVADGASADELPSISHSESREADSH